MKLRIKSSLWLGLLTFSNVFSQNIISSQDAIGTSGSTVAVSCFDGTDNSYYLFKFINLPNPSEGMGNIGAVNLGNDFAVLTKYNNDHTVLWSKSYGGSGLDVLGNVIQVSDGFILAFRSNSPISQTKTVEGNGMFHIWLVKLDFEGENVWQRTLEHDSNLALPTLFSLDNGNFLVSSSANEGISGDKTENGIGQADGWIVKLDADGNIIWDKVYGTEEIDLSFGFSGQLPNGNLILSTTSDANISGDKTENAYGPIDTWIICISPTTGEIIWDKTIGGNSTDRPTDCIILENEIVFLISSRSPISGVRTIERKGTEDTWVVQLNHSGEIISQFCIGGNETDFSAQFLDYSNNSYLIAVNSTSNIGIDKNENSRGGSDIWLVYCDIDGNIYWQKTIGGSSADSPGFIRPVGNTAYQFFAYSESGVSGDKTVPKISQSYGDIWVLDLNLEVLQTEEYTNKNALIYPNPAQNSINIENIGGFETAEISLCDASGKIVLKQKYEGLKMQIDLTDLHSGVYTLWVQNEAFSEYHRIVISKN